MSNEKKKKKSLEGINPMLFLVVVMIIVVIASYLVPAGSFERVYDAAVDRDIVVPGSFQYTEQNPIGFFDLMMSLTLGIQNASYIIAFLLIIGGMFAIMDGTGAINYTYIYSWCGPPGERADHDPRADDRVRPDVLLLRQF